ncbi:MAG: hypothetical protein WBD50_00135 [Candidatus Rhabdochlamydia sp.]
MVLPTGYNLKATVPNESLSSQQEQSTTKEKIGPMNQESSSMTLERLPRPPQDPLNMAMFEKYLKERNPDPITPITSSEDSESNFRHLSAPPSKNIEQQDLQGFEQNPFDQASSSMTLERLPRPPQDPLNMAMFEKYLKERNPDPITPLEGLGQNLNKNIEQNPYGHETPDSNPPTPLSTSSEDSEFPLGASIDVFEN